MNAKWYQVRSFSKPQAALAIVEEIEKTDSTGVAQQIKDIINQAISLAAQSA